MWLFGDELKINIFEEAEKRLKTFAKRASKSEIDEGLTLF